MKISKITTKIGDMVAISDDNYLYLLEFANSYVLDKKIKKNTNIELIKGDNDISKLVEKEMNQYLSGNLKDFSVPISLIGSDFSKSVWQEISKIPYNDSISYSEIALNIGKELSFRAVANACGGNPIIIIIPCHRVISKDGSLGGYSSGIDRKICLRDLEKTYG